MGGGRGDFFSLQEFFFTSTASTGLFFGGGIPCTIFLVGGGGWELVGENILLTLTTI